MVSEIRKAIMLKDKTQRYTKGDIQTMKYKPSNGGGYSSRKISEMTPLELDKFADLQDEIIDKLKTKAAGEGKKSPSFGHDSAAELIFALGSFLNEPGKTKS